MYNSTWEHQPQLTNLPYPSDVHLEGFMYVCDLGLFPCTLIILYTVTMWAMWLWRLWKWLLRLFTGHCELERLCYKRLPTHQLAVRVGMLLYE